MPTWPDITVTADAVSNQSTFYDASSNNLSIISGLTDAATRVAGFRFFIPSTFEAGNDISSFVMKLYANANVASFAYKLAVLEGDDPNNWANTTNVETGKPWYRRSSTKNTQAIQTGTVAMVASTYTSFDIPGELLTAALEANPNHATNGTNLTILLWPANLESPVSYQFISSESAIANSDPILQIEFYVGHIKLQLGGSTSGRGGVSLNGGPQCFGRWHGDKPELLGKNPLIPKSTAGAGDLPPTSLVASANPNGTTWAAWANAGAPQPQAGKTRLDRADQGAITPGNRPEDNFDIYFEDYAGASPKARWNTHYWRERNETSLKTCSGTISIKYDSLPVLDDPSPMVIQAQDASSNIIWAIEYRSYTIDNKSHQVRIWNYADGVGLPWSTTRYANLGWHRWEFQVSDEAVGQEIKARLYLGESTTPSEELSLSCSTTEFEYIVIGASSAAVVSLYVNDVELWDDYYLNGKWRDERTYGELYEFGEWGDFVYDGPGQFTPIEYYGRVTSLSPLVIDTDATFWDPLRDYEGEHWRYSGPSDLDPLCYTKYSDLSYATSTPSLQKADLFVPVGIPPADGWPVLFWLHGGFFVANTKNIIPLGFVADMCANGIAVISLDVILSSSAPAVNQASGIGSTSYPEWNKNVNSARHPTQILDYKLAVSYFMDQTFREIHNLRANPIVCGHSAGGYPALMAMITKDLTDDGSGLSYRLQDHISDYGYPNIPDPDIAGAFVMSAPTDFAKLDAYDFTRPNMPFLSTGQYTMETTIQFIWGLNFTEQPTSTQLTGASVEHAILNAPLANLKPLTYYGGMSDWLVPSNPHFPDADQAQPLKDAYETRGVGGLCKIVRQAQVQHYQTPYRYNSEDLVKFVKTYAGT